MLRLMGFLCAGIYVAMLIGGQDRGQLRFGLIQAQAEKAAAVQAADFAAAQAVLPTASPSDAADARVVAASFVPERPLMASPTITQETSDAPAPVIAEGRLLYVAAQSVNVREGPGKDHAVIDRLPQGEAVLVLVQGEGPDGWSLIRIEGDGIEGYVASRLLTE